jgi:hypothetical protein
VGRNLDSYTAEGLQTLATQDNDEGNSNTNERGWAAGKVLRIAHELVFVQSIEPETKFIPPPHPLPFFLPSTRSPVHDVHAAFRQQSETRAARKWGLLFSRKWGLLFSR